MKVFLVLALVVGPPIQSLAADAPATDAPDFTAGPLPSGYKLLAPSDIAVMAKAKGLPEPATTTEITYACVSDTSRCVAAIVVSKPETSDVGKRSFLKGFLDETEAQIIKSGYKLTSNDGISWDKADPSKPYVANLVFENTASGQKLFMIARVTFVSGVPLMTLVTSPAKSDMKPLMDWVDSIKLK